MELSNLKHVSLKSHPEINEKIVQDYIAEHPECLRLGDLELVDREREVSNGGRIDLLFKDIEDEFTRYVVEIQLGDADTSHIVRVVDYKEQEDVRCSRYKHVGVLVAENATTCRWARFLRNYSDFYGLVVLQMDAVKLEEKDSVSLSFVKVLDGRRAVYDDSSQVSNEPATRESWEDKVGKDMMKQSDEFLEKVVKPVSPDVESSYKKHYVGLTVNGIANNWCCRWPRKTKLDVEFAYIADEEEVAELRGCGLDIAVKDRTIVRSVPKSLDSKQIELLQEIVKKSRDMRED